MRSLTGEVTAFGVVVVRIEQVLTQRPLVLPAIHILLLRIPSEVWVRIQVSVSTVFPVQIPLSQVPRRETLELSADTPRRGTCR